MPELRLEAGDAAPEFALPDQDGASISLSDFAGSKVILYFYPEASTPACTTQACDFRDNLNTLKAAGYQVIGLSKDAVPALKKFAIEEHLNFPVLSDPELTVHKAYGTWGEKNSYGRIVTGTLRSTFVIDEKGTITMAFYNVKAKGHIGMLSKRLL